MKIVADKIIVTIAIMIVQAMKIKSNRDYIVTKSTLIRAHHIGPSSFRHDLIKSQSRGQSRGPLTEVFIATSDDLWIESALRNA